MLKDYIVLDLETPNRYNNSISSIGIVKIENGEKTDEIYSLINPEAPFDTFNINFTGIKPEDVKDSPTFKEYWKEIKDITCNNTIVGQNITFDLSVISKTLINYNMGVPSFEYYCTLKSCKRHLHLYDNSLSNIVHTVLKKTYNAHNAMDDARMTNELFCYLKKYETDRSEFLDYYSYRPHKKRDFNRTYDYDINYLYGLLQKYQYKDTISDNYKKLIINWYEKNKSKNRHPLLKVLLLKVKYIKDNNEITTKQIQNLVMTLKPILRSPKFTAETLRLQILEGVLDSIICEKQVQTEDYEFIHDFIYSKPFKDKEVKKLKKQLKEKQYDNMDEQLFEVSEYLQHLLKE